MANTLYIVEDDFYTNLPTVVRATTLAETTKLMTFLPGFKVSVIPPPKFPTKYDFTDSVVRVVNNDAAVSAFSNNSMRQQGTNLVQSAKNNGVKLDAPASKHNAGAPDGGGTGFQMKVVLEAGSNKLLFVLTGGAASLEFAKEAVVEQLTDGRTESEIRTKQRTLIEGRPGRPGMGKAKYDASNQGKADAKHLEAHKMAAKPIGDWPSAQQISVATALARIIAHEARHQYVAAHYSGGGLGAGEAAFWGDKNFEQFDEGDQKEIQVAIKGFAEAQKTATIHLETNPTKQPFPF